VSPACPGEDLAPGPRASRVSPTAPGSAPRHGQPGGSGSGGPSARFPAGQPRRRRGPPPPATVPGRPDPRPREIATAAAPSPSAPAAAAAGRPPSSRLGCARPRAEPARRVSPGPIPRRGSLRGPPASAAAGPPARARAPADRARGSGGDTQPDRCRQARRRRACRCSWPAPDSHGAAPSQGPACPPPRSGRGAAGPPRCGQAGQTRRPTHPSRARRYPPARAAGPTRPPHPGGNAPPPRPTFRTRTARPAPPAQDREAPQPSSVPPDPQPQLGRPSYDAERALDLLERDPAA
jgi:translation initiation factor IF-2